MMNTLNHDWSLKSHESCSSKLLTNLCNTRFDLQKVLWSGWECRYSKCWLYPIKLLSDIGPTYLQDRLSPIVPACLTRFLKGAYSRSPSIMSSGWTQALGHLNSNTCLTEQNPLFGSLTLTLLACCQALKTWLLPQAFGPGLLLIWFFWLGYIAYLGCHESLLVTIVLILVCHPQTLLWD